MTIKDLEKEIPGLTEYTKTMPEEIRKKSFCQGLSSRKADPPEGL